MAVFDDFPARIRESLDDAAALCDALGLTQSPFLRQPRGLIVCCPWHEDRNPSCSVRREKDGTIAAVCFSCNGRGDALSLIGAVHGLSLKTSFKDVLRAGAEIAGLHDIIDALSANPSGTRPKVAYLPPRPKLPPEPERDFPPQNELGAVWTHSTVTAESAIVEKWLSGRGLDADEVDSFGLMRVLTDEAIRRCPTLARGMAYKGLSWFTTGHVALVPMYDVYGRFRSVRGCRVIDGDSPKRLPPGGFKGSGLVMADGRGVSMLRGELKPARVVIVEGEPDFLTWATRDVSDTATLGIVSGSWSPEMASRIPIGTSVVIRTDHDRAGNAYAADIARTLRGRFLFRTSPGALNVRNDRTETDPDFDDAREPDEATG